MKLPQRFNWLAPLALLVLILVFFARLAFTNLILARGDTYVYFYPYWQTARAALRAGRLPLWNDLLFMGAPFMANSQVGLLYPPNWPPWLLAPDTPTAVKWSILLHLAWAGLGTFLLLRAPLRLGAFAALAGAALFTVGGHLTAHVEQINQLQGLSWLPWLCLLLALSREMPWRWGPLLAGALALQLLSGHMQTVFISLIGMGVMALWWGWRDGSDGSARHWRPLITLALAGIAAIPLTLPQLAPMLELSGLSNRSGGLAFDEVISFSLHPALIGRALLPGYDMALPGEYFGTLGVAGLALAVIGAWAARKDPRWSAWIVMAALGLFLAPGGWNPVYWLLGRLPGFNLFRVPARWLVLWALGGSALAAYAVQRLTDSRPPRRLAVVIAAVVILLVASAYLAPLVAGPHAPGLTPPTPGTVAGWLLAAAIATVAIRRAPGRWRGAALVAVAVFELFAASRQMPYNHPTAPDAFATARPTTYQLLTHQDNTIPPGRFLSISHAEFGFTDQPIIQTAFQTQLYGQVIHDLLVATKLKDLLAPNLGMIWGLPSVDGFDGGVLPLRTYTAFTRLLLENPPPDGRLRENLAAIPEQRWLDLMDVRYLITDRMNDRQYQGINFDLSWRTPLANGATVTVADLPPFEATGLALVIDTPGEPGPPLATVDILGQRDAFTLPLTGASPVAGGRHALATLSWGSPQVLDGLRITGESDGLILQGAALLDERTGASHILTVTPGGQWELLQLGDVKIYEAVGGARRAFLVTKAEVIPDDEDALARMAGDDFDPRRTVILAEGEPLAAAPHPGEATITHYAPEHVAITISSRSDAYLVLTDTYYPGWTAALDGEPVPIRRADLTFRAVYVPAGEHTLTLTYAPTSWPGALFVGALAWLGLSGGALIAWWRMRVVSRRSGKN